MNVCVAILTTLSDVAEDRLHMAQSARGGCVQTAQRVFRLIVIELGNCPYWFPGVCGMAVLARYVEISVWAMSPGRSLCASVAGAFGERQKHKYNQPERAPRSRHNLILRV